jgi:hypothetical protein
MEERLKFGKSDIVLPDVQDQINADAIFKDYLNPMFDSGKYKFRADLSEVPFGSYKHKICAKTDLVIEDLTTGELIILDFKRANLKELEKRPFTPIGSIGRRYNFDFCTATSGDVYVYGFQLGSYRKLYMLQGHKVKSFIFLIGICPGDVGWTLTRVCLYGSTKKIEPIAKTVNAAFAKREQEMVDRYFTNEYHDDQDKNRL